MSRQLRPVVITGASRGFGAALTRHFAGLGHDVAVCARNASSLESLASELRDDLGVAVVTAPLDVTDAVAVGAFAALVAGELGPSCAVVNNAGILGPVGPVDQIDITAWRRALEVNVVGTVTVTAAFVPQLAAGGGGSIVNLSGAGIGGPDPLGGISAYASSKGAVVTLTEALAMELRGRRVRVNALAPGVLKTGFMDSVLEAEPGVVDERLHAIAAAVRPSGGSARVELDPNLAELISFLISNESDWITGKLVSARWDSVASLSTSRERLVRSSLLNVRRIDDNMFVEAEHR